MQSSTKQLPPPTAEEMLLDLRDTAYHEAGHAVMMKRFGGEGNALVWRNFSGDPTESAWRGQFGWWVCPEAKRNDAKSLGLPKIAVPKNWEVLFAAAGMVAEEIAAGIRDPRWVSENVYSRILMDEASPTDLKSMGITDIYNFDADQIDRNIRQACRYLLQDWALVRDEAEYLISFAQMPHSGYSANLKNFTYV